MNKKVLLVDDEPNLLMSLEFLMKKEGFTVYIARNGTEALEAIISYIPDLVVLDIMMPEVDGYEVCEKLKQNPETSQAKVVFLSAKSKPEDIQKGYALGANLYLTKPFSTRTLMKEIKVLLN